MFGENANVVSEQHFIFDNELVDVMNEKSEVRSDSLRFIKKLFNNENAHF